MSDFERGFREELEKIALSADDIGRLLGQPIRSATEGAGDIGRALGQGVRDVGGGLSEAGGQVGEALGTGAEALGEGATGFGEQSGLINALRSIPTPDIQAGHLLGAGLGATAGGLGGYYAGKKATGTTKGGLGGAALGALGGGALGAGAGHMIGGDLHGRDLAAQAAKQQEMQGLMGGLRGLGAARAAEAGRDAGAMQGAEASSRMAQIAEQLRGTTAQAREHALRGAAHEDWVQQMLRSGQDLPPWQLEYQG